VSKVSKPTDVEFRKIVEQSSSYSEVLVSLGLVPKGGTSSKALKRRIEALSISTTHFKVRGEWAKTTHAMEDILVEDSSYTNMHRLKLRLVADGLIDYLCNECGNTGIWRNKPITLQLDHINGVSNDHRLTNLRFLCPNCHTQTETYSGRNKGVGLGDQL
jgi:5-methylcytosine-specific restriction endonuclease McrA